MTADTGKPDERDTEMPTGAEAGEQQETESYNAWDDGFRVSMLLLLAIGLPLFLASLYFVLYAVFTR